MCVRESERAGVEQLYSKREMGGRGESERIYRQANSGERERERRHVLSGQTVCFHP